MSTITLSDLRKSASKRILQSASAEDLVVTSDGQPVAVWVPVGPDNLEPTLATLRSVRALQAQAALQKTSAANGAAAISAEGIESEIASSRRSRRRS